MLIDMFKDCAMLMLMFGISTEVVIVDSLHVSPSCFIIS